ncbi:MAG: hypothetical protein QXM31_00105 [Candidatus Woesearchaeota archaeon]
MIGEKRGNAALVVFAVVAIAALAGFAWLAGGGTTGMAAKPYVFDPKTVQKSKLDDPWAGLTNSIVVRQHANYADCRWDCLALQAKRPFNVSGRRQEAKACLEKCAANFGNPQWGYATKHYLNPTGGKFSN